MRASNPVVEVVGPRPRRGGLVLASVLIFCILILSAQVPARGRRGSLLQAWILTASAPAAITLSNLSRAITRAFDSGAELLTTRSENSRLKEEIVKKDQELFTLRARVTSEELDQQLLAGSSVLPQILTAAPILLVENRAGLQSAVIGAGAQQGVSVGCPIAVPEGLVGRVVTVGRSIARAQLLVDASAAAGARIVRTGEVGVVRGDGRGRLRMQNIPTTSSVQPGDRIETAGIDGIYPRGVVIGGVEKVSRGSLFLEISVVPTASFSQLIDVLVLAPSPAREDAASGGKGAQP
ncbi:MAG TPA: rod shape-determining protein MreC [Thermoanaerobaculia bacterium]